MSAELLLNGRSDQRNRNWLLERNPDWRALYDMVKKTGAHQWIGLVRAEDAAGRLDMVETAKNIGVPLNFESLPDIQYHGYTTELVTGDIDNVAITINTVFTDDWRQTFGHEVGHIFLSLVLGQHPRVGENHDAIEQFCEFFAYEMVMPDCDIQMMSKIDERAIQTLAAKNELKINTVLMRLMLAGKLPEKVAVDRRFLGKVVPKYANKICRDYVCLECRLGDKCSATLGDDIRVISLPDQQWSGSVCANEPDYFWGTERMKELNDKYKQGGT